MKRICIVLMLFLALFVQPKQEIFADDGAELNLFYNFDGYDAECGERIYPDERWTASTIGTRYNYGGYYDEEEDNYMMCIPKGAEPTLLFGDLYKQGIIHISFDAKVSEDGVKAYFIFYDGRIDDKTTLGTDNYSKTFVINKDEPGEIAYFVDGTNTSLAGWVAEQSNLTADFKEWHRFDIITTDISASNATINYYMDGQKINQRSDIYYGFSKGFKSFSVRAEADSGSVYLDNLRVRRYFTNPGIEGWINGDSRVIRNAPEIEVMLSEKIDSSKITKENMYLVNTNTSQEISDYDIIYADDYKFKIKVNCELSSGIYHLRLKDEISSEITGQRMVIPVEFRTEYRTCNIYNKFIDETFESYAFDETDPSMPDGWIAVDSAENILCGTGTGGEEDRTFGVKDAESTRVAKMFAYPFDVSISPGVTYDISFDVYSKNMYWYFNLLESNDIEDDTFKVDNVAIASMGSKGQMYYAEQRTDSKFKKLTDLEVSPDGWHNIKLRVIPLENAKTEYRILVDGGDECSVITNRAFMTSPTGGIAFGYIATNNNNELYIDNIKIEANMQTLYPEVESVLLYQYDGKVVGIGDSVTTAINKIKIVFNTFIDESSVEECINVYENGSPINYAYTLVEENNVSVLYIEFTEMLIPSMQYTLEILEGIKSYYSNEATSDFGETKEFFTAVNCYFNIFENNYNEERGEYIVKIVKNDNSAARFTIAVATYETYFEEVNGSLQEFKQLKALKYIPVDIKEYEKGVFEYNCLIPVEGNVSVKTFINNYPDFMKTRIGENGKLN